MMSATEALCEEWAATLGYWIDVTQKAIDEPINEPTWVLDTEALQRMQPILRQIPPADLASLFANFGFGLLHSLLVSFEQGPLRVEGPALAVVEAESGAPLKPGLNELFTSAAIAGGLIA